MKSLEIYYLNKIGTINTRRVDGMAVANKLEEMWNFPNCIGAVEGKHILEAPNLIIKEHKLLC